MKIAIIGYGRMGKAIEQIAEERGHQIVLRIDGENVHQLTSSQLEPADVAIEFSQPAAAFQNIVSALRANVPVVSGTTGWLSELEAVKEVCSSEHGAFLYASNFSIGMNIMFALNKRLARMMNQHPAYQASMQEIHHIHKKDAPSGTAITLATQILHEVPRLDDYYLTEDKQAHDNQKSHQLPIESERIGETPGTHRVRWSSDIDTIELCHIAHNRKGFALGAVLAAEWIIGKKGCFDLNDVFGFEEM